MKGGFIRKCVSLNGDYIFVIWNFLWIYLKKVKERNILLSVAIFHHPLNINRLLIVIITFILKNIIKCEDWATSQSEICKVLIIP